MSEKTELDLSGANRNMWLVKVPKYISQRWEKADNTSDGVIGSLRIGQKLGKPEISFNMNSKLAKLKDKADDPELTVEHKFQVLSAMDRVLTVYTEATDNPDGASESTSKSKKKSDVAIEGKVIQRMECRPVGGDHYMKMKRLQIQQAQKPVRITQQLNSHVVKTFKPVRDHQMNIEFNRMKKEQGKKARMDADKVKDLLFNAFERHQYYTFKDLVGITQQPSPYLKEILREIGTYNVKAPHKFMWELKPEYRHYQEPKDEAGPS
ncbi:general transcription factor IIF subunit 2-like [Amphiura filiformis]|uniref:general transcription factor IIF subunit 2-like n=1 Tax=Amphiura filiformis TaxID=82378 RepID=UPI003B2241DA